MAARDNWHRNWPEEARCVQQTALRTVTVYALFSSLIGLDLQYSLLDSRQMHRDLGIVPCKLGVRRYGASDGQEANVRDQTAARPVRVRLLQPSEHDTTRTDLNLRRIPKVVHIALVRLALPKIQSFLPK